MFQRCVETTLERGNPVERFTRGDSVGVLRDSWGVQGEGGQSLLGGGAPSGWFSGD